MHFKYQLNNKSRQIFVAYKVQPITKKWINESDQNRIKPINDNIKQVGDNVDKSLLDKYQDNRFVIH